MRLINEYGSTTFVGSKFSGISERKGKFPEKKTIKLILRVMSVSYNQECVNLLQVPDDIVIKRIKMKTNKKIILNHTVYICTEAF